MVHKGVHKGGPQKGSTLCRHPLKNALGLYVDAQGILRLKGRLENMDGDIDKRFPIFLDNKGYFSELVILDSHRKVKHNRVKDTLNQLRSSYWITQGRRTVKRVIAKCHLRKVFDATSLHHYQNIV